MGRRVALHEPGLRTRSGAPPRGDCGLGGSVSSDRIARDGPVPFWRDPRPRTLVLGPEWTPSFYTRALLGDPAALGWIYLLHLLLRSTGGPQLLARAEARALAVSAVAGACLICPPSLGVPWAPDFYNADFVASPSDRLPGDRGLLRVRGWNVARQERPSAFSSTARTPRVGQSLGLSLRFPFRSRFAGDRGSMGDGIASALAVDSGRGFTGKSISPCMSLIEKIILTLAMAIAVAGTIISHVAPSYFAERFVVEDGFIEWLTVIALAASAVLMLTRAWTLKGVLRRCFFLSPRWPPRSSFSGRRGDLVGTTDLFRGNARVARGAQQAEGDEPPQSRDRGHSINKLVFSKLLGVVLLLYLIVLAGPLPEASARWDGFVNRAGIPLPRNWHVIVWITALLFTEVAVGTSKRGELREVLLTLILFVQLLRPLNVWIYDRERNLLSGERGFARIPANRAHENDPRFPDPSSLSFATLTAQNETAPADRSLRNRRV